MLNKRKKQEPTCRTNPIIPTDTHPCVHRDSHDTNRPFLPLFRTSRIRSLDVSFGIIIQLDTPHPFHYNLITGPDLSWVPVRPGFETEACLVGEDMPSKGRRGCHRGRGR